MSSAQRPRDVRFRASVPVFIVRRGGVEPAELIDASYRGLGLRVEAAPPKRQLVKLRMELPSRRLEVHAVVVRTRSNIHGRQEVGLQFFALNGDDLTEWEAFVEVALRQRCAA